MSAPPRALKAARLDARSKSSALTKSLPSGGLALVGGVCVEDALNDAVDFAGAIAQ